MPNGVLTGALFGMPPAWIKEVVSWLCGREVYVKGFSGPGEVVPEQRNIALGFGSDRKSTSTARSPHFKIHAGRDLTLPGIGARYYQLISPDARDGQETVPTETPRNKTLKPTRGPYKVRKSVKVKGGKMA